MCLTDFADLKCCHLQNSNSTNNIASDDASLNCTVIGEQPEIGLPEKLILGDGKIVSCTDALPSTHFHR